MYAHLLWALIFSQAWWHVLAGSSTGLLQCATEKGSPGGTSASLLPFSPQAHTTLSGQRAISHPMCCIPALFGEWFGPGWSQPSWLWHALCLQGVRQSLPQPAKHILSCIFHQDHFPLRVNHWARLIMMISHLKRTKIATSCNPAHVILNHVLPYISFIFWLLS